MASSVKKSSKSKPHKNAEILMEKRALIQATIRKKQECEKKALTIVEQLIENPVTEQWLLDNAKFINQSHYQDVVEERALSRLCGYPLCQNKILDVPKKQYSIDRKTKKVYDLTNRKNYCSDICFQISVYFKNQLLTSPLWLRDEEKIPVFNVKIEAKGLSGDEVPLNSFAVPDEDSEKGYDSNEESIQSLKPPSNDGHQLKLIAENSLKKMDKLSYDPVLAVKNKLESWMTVNTRRYIFQDSTENPNIHDDYQSKYEELCKKLDTQELHDRITDKQHTSMENPKLKPVASFEEIRKEALQANLKVRAFYGGKWEYADAPDESPSEPDNLTSDDSSVFIPLVDATSQHALRRRIVLEHLEKSVPLMVGALGLKFEDLRSDLKLLINTFNLSPDTITFRPRERSLITLALIKLLSLKNLSLKKRMEENDAQCISTEILNSYELKSTFLDDLIDEILTSLSCT